MYHTEYNYVSYRVQLCIIQSTIMYHTEYNYVSYRVQLCIIQSTIVCIDVMNLLNALPDLNILPVCIAETNLGLGNHSFF
jgi:hypothetical protein